MNCSLTSPSYSSLTYSSCHPDEIPSYHDVGWLQDLCEVFINFQGMHAMQQQNVSLISYRFFYVLPTLLQYYIRRVGTEKYLPLSICRYGITSRNMENLQISTVSYWVDVMTQQPKMRMEIHIYE